MKITIIITHKIDDDEKNASMNKLVLMKRNEFSKKKLN
jgi:hypothetical protein